MDVEQQNDGRWHFALGPVERWIVAGIAALVVVLAGAIVSACAWWANQLTAQVKSQNDKLEKLVTQQAVTNGQMATLSLQLADVPKLTSGMAELKVRVDRNTEDIAELRGMKGLK